MFLKLKLMDVVVYRKKSFVIFPETHSCGRDRLIKWLTWEILISAKPP